MLKILFAMKGTIILTINGTKYEVPNNVPVDTSLNDFLTVHANLHDTKTMCNEGGCGACVVSVRCEHPVTANIMCLAVNSCLVPVYSCHGWDITTVTGLGNKQSGYHTLQTTLAKYNGTQCGYCSPGMVMNMHSLMEDNEYITMQEVENSFSGNICRCTGYRPILDAFKSLACDADSNFDIEDLHEYVMCPRNTVNCNKLHKGNITNMFKVENQNITWYKVRTMNDILGILRRHKGLPYMLVGGNTGQGVYRIKVPPKVYIDINGVAELKDHTVAGNIVLGANVTLTEAMRYLSEDSGMEQFKYVQEIVKHIDLVANVPVRNIGTIAGNLSLKNQHKEFPSDLFVVLEAAGALLKIVDTNGVELFVRPSTFLGMDMTNKIIVTVTLPPLTGNFAFKSYKIMPLSQNAHAYVNAGFYVRFNNSTGNVESAILVFGGIKPSFVHACNTENFLRDVNIFDNAVLGSALDILNSELQPDWVLPDPSPRYRKNLALSLFYKFVLNMCPDKLLSPKNKSGAELLIRGLSSGRQVFETNKELWPLQQPISKLEALVQCAGEAEYIGYIPLRPGELFASFVLAYGKPLMTISNIDPKDALAMKGVKAFFSANDIPGKNSFVSNKIPLIVEDEEVFCSGLLRYWGQPVGVIVAESQLLANRAAKLVHLEYTPTERTPYADVRDVLAHENTPERVQLQYNWTPSEQGHDVVHVFTGSHHVGCKYHFPMETLPVVCVPKEDGLDVYPSSQAIDFVQIAISQVLNIPENRINIHIRRVGGAFGLKITRTNQVAAACAVAAYQLNQPVRMLLSLEDTMNAIGKSYSLYNNYKVAVNETGKIQYLSNDFYQNFGCSLNENIMSRTLELFENCYDKSSFTVNAFSVLTETPSNTSFRAPGATEGASMIETIMEHIAHVTGVDPLDVRIANMRTENNLVREIIDDFRQKTEYDTRKVKINEFNLENRWRKRGIAILPMSFPILYYGKLSAMVSIYHGDGTVAVSHAGVECGQGINTKVAQVCAYTLGIPLDKISIKPTDNMISPNSAFTAGSVTSESCCAAVIGACKVILERLQPIREQLDNPTWEELITEAYNQMVDLQAIHSFKPDKPVSFAYEVAGLAACEVEVDILTGNILLLRVDIREETGESMSPEVDVGQVEGAFVMSLGYWLTEQIIYDRKTCELKTNRTWNYKPPGAKDIPIDFRIEFTRNAKNPVGILRSKGTGEPAMCLGFVAVCAIRHALQSARMDANGGKPTDWFPLGAPTSPEQIFLQAKNDYRQFTI